uniref:uncharacterized protein isoform X5 n=1 Tax=Pristiophorus japonicus TaxID=55135 RepID=UPI00398E6ACD
MTSLPGKRLNSDLRECAYRFPAEVVKELNNVHAMYRDLSVCFDFYYNGTGVEKKLVNLNGTIPVPCKGLIYNVPISIWLHKAHPLNPPKCFVKSLPIPCANPGIHIDDTGMMSSSYLCNWKYPASHLVGLIEDVRTSFMNCLNNPTQTALSQAHLSQDSLAIHPQPSCTIVPSIGNSYQSLQNVPQPLDSSCALPVSSSEWHLRYQHQGSGYSVSPARISASSSLLSSRSSYEAVKGKSDVHFVAKGAPLHSGECTSNKSKKTSYVTELMSLGITFSPSPAEASPPMGTNSKDHAVKKKMDSVEQTADCFKDLHLDNVLNAFNLVTSSQKKQGVADFTFSSDRIETEDAKPLSLHHTQNSSLHKDKRRVHVLKIPVEFPGYRIKDKLIIFFQRARNGGGEIVDFQYPTLIPGSAVITFDDAKVAERLVQQEHHEITINNKNFPVQVKLYNEKDGVLAKDDADAKILTLDMVHTRQTRFDLSSIAVGLSKEKSQIFQSLLSLEENFSVEEVMEVVQSGLNYESALRYLSHECPICSEQVSFNKIITMTHCSCSFCEDCFKNYFSSVIKEKNIVNVVCPMCSKPDLKSHQLQEDITEYFNLLDIQIRHYLDEETHELFQRKLRDRTLMEMPNFRWCAHCSFGLLHEVDRLRMDCPSCEKSTCFQCKIPWEQQHEGISCEKFKIWKQQNNPEYQASKLDVYLTKNGIECPNCRVRFDLARGGCIHFNCTECQYQFCGGCKRPFKLGSVTGACVTQTPCSPWGKSERGRSERSHSGAGQLIAASHRYGAGRSFKNRWERPVDKHVCLILLNLLQACAFMSNCHTKGLHAHHPRDCFYHLRDWSVERMQQLLNTEGISLTALVTDNLLGQVEGKCKVMEQKETSYGLKDEQCGHTSVKGNSGFCNADSGRSVQQTRLPTHPFLQPLSAPPVRDCNSRIGLYSHLRTPF